MKSNEETKQFLELVTDQDHDELDTEEWTVSSEDASIRIDKFITDRYEGASRTLIQQWIREHDVLVNDQPVKPNYKLQIDDTIRLIIPELSELEVAAESIELDVIYEDRDLIVVNKPRGMVVHPAPGHTSGTLVNALLHHCDDLSGINGVLRPGIVHRIDKDTSGLLVAAKNDKAHASLAAQLKDHTVVRKYIALVHGKLEHDVGTIDAPIGRDPKDRKMYTVTANNSKRAVSHFQVLERYGPYSLLEMQLETGRTHQIRVHMKYIGHPLVGDPIYGTGNSKHNLHFQGGQALHACQLGFIHPSSQQYVDFNSQLPEDMDKVIQLLRLRTGNTND